MAPQPRVSGLQRQVLAFYRTVLRRVRTQPAEQRGNILAYTRAEFERYRSADKRDYQLIEHLLRKGNRQLDMLQDSHVTGIKMRDNN